MTTPDPDPDFLRKPEEHGQPAQPATPQQPYVQQPYPGQPHQQPYAGQPGAQQPAWGAPVGQPLRPDDERTWAIVAHLLPLIGVGFLAPLVIWLVFRGRGPYLEDQAKESLNFQLTLLIGAIVGAILLIVVVGILVLIAVGIASLVFAILAAVACSRYEWYRYPVSIRFVK
ncbi:DUF4870 domain-containing protein [Cellulomonas edaphi]|uniref:DUF4870 domain-containing protein n=1 Tax=Cellulomonas edaphi TaxID=3053468 RepID=A0ABT7S7F1_9CELL|nr:DUF4870 domain-containing protein [Cellulomons edaphi]MDM7831555.1 DUF4870 domain-containing protein [Cellulomons edaphi]